MKKYRWITKICQAEKSFPAHQCISRNQLSRGGSCVAGFLRTFLQKITFLRPQEVPGCHKNIYRELRACFTRFEIFGNICCFFRQQTQHLLTSWWPGTPKGLCGNYEENVDFWLVDPKNHFKVFDRPTNIAGGRLDILFHFPNDWYKNTEG